MNTLSRKQREIRQRNELLLDIAESIICDGCHNELSMDRLAEISEYSKGTVYQHFSCKEELLVHLCIRGMRTLVGLFKKAAAYTGNTRERITAVCLAHRLYARLMPLHFSMIQVIKGGPIREKVSPESQQIVHDLEKAVIGTLMAVIIEAIEKNELELPPGIQPGDVLYGFWASSYGGLLLQTYEINYQELRIDDPDASLERMVQAHLDGLNWSPLTRNFDYRKTIKKLTNDQELSGHQHTAQH